jgi:hypothetical protein
MRLSPPYFSCRGALRSFYPVLLHIQHCVVVRRLSASSARSKWC